VTNGRQIDAEICGKVFGQPVEVQDGDFITLAEPDNPAAGWWLVPSYSTEISAAWSVLEKLRQGFRWCCIDIHSNFHYQWTVSLIRNDESENATHTPLITESAESAPSAICAAALRAVADNAT